MLPREFIQTVLIDEIGKITKTNAYVSFALMVLGIEFLGRCDDGIKYWHQKDISEECFNNAIEYLMKKYQSYKLYGLLRCGYAHYLAPQKGLSLHEAKHEKVHLSVDSDGNLILNVEDFYCDFKCACEKIIDRINNGNFYNKNGKIYKDFLNTKN